MMRIFASLVALSLMASCSNAAFAQPAPTEDARLLPYAQPSQLVDIRGRRINLHCSGEGTPTIVLMAGLSSWSAVWYKVQPEIAKRTRVCAFDRASYGFSDPPPRPQILPDVVNDLHETLKSAHAGDPYVLVGHSLGGLEARLFAQKWPQEVVGMVLVDSSPAAELLIEANEPESDESKAGERYATVKLTCVMLAARGQLRPDDPIYPECSLGLPSDAPAAFRNVASRFWTADYAAAMLSQLSSLRTHRYDSVDRLRLGDRPLIVLSADVSSYNSAFWKGYAKKWFAQHKALARMSSRGMHRIIKGAGHMIQLDKPEVIVDAVEEVLRKLSVNKP